MKRQNFIILLFFCSLLQAQPSGVYQNPILHADYSDPDVIRVGDDFYMTASSFNCVPGLPILHSKD
ncbi:Non-reducing end alpha-L-arabinofuranosidase BoGH43A, partial [termite gut metagenome]